MNLNLLFDIEVNNNLEVKWLSFKIETSLLYTYYREISKEECICIFKVVQKILADKMANHCDDNEMIKQIRYVMREIKKHIEYLKNFIEE